MGVNPPVGAAVFPRVGRLGWEEPQLLVHLEDPSPVLIGHCLRPAVLADDKVLAWRRYLAQLQRSLKYGEGEDDGVALQSEYLHLGGAEEASVRWRDGEDL